MQTPEIILQWFSRNLFPGKLRYQLRIIWNTGLLLRFLLPHSMTLSLWQEISGSICICGRTPFSWTKGYDDLVCRNLFIRSNVKWHHLGQLESGQTLRWLFHLWQMPSLDLHKVTREWITITLWVFSNLCQRIGISTKRFIYFLPRPLSELTKVWAF